MFANEAYTEKKGNKERDGPLCGALKQGKIRMPMAQWQNYAYLCAVFHKV